ncbi:hypothetical protein PAPYR_12824 [Paratrimastix pyriformis]|uniref:Uncharacterized protein n=1 Tax=Paratrimastix pyriformis TaxID=342808 RepID=A0ABQ8U7V9_9EUKA|nr:hypothetical protein PAPYR_12824 [Paratrimastix pyriformis]
MAKRILHPDLLLTTHAPESQKNLKQTTIKSTAVHITIKRPPVKKQLHQLDGDIRSLLPQKRKDVAQPSTSHPKGKPKVDQMPPPSSPPAPIQVSSSDLRSVSRPIAPSPKTHLNEREVFNAALAKCPTLAALLQERTTAFATTVQALVCFAFLLMDISGQTSLEFLPIVPPKLAPLLSPAHDPLLVLCSRLPKRCFKEQDGPPTPQVNEFLGRLDCTPLPKEPLIEGTFPPQEEPDEILANLTTDLVVAPSRDVLRIVSSPQTRREKKMRTEDEADAEREEESREENPAPDTVFTVDLDEKELPRVDALVAVLFSGED